MRVLTIRCDFCDEIIPEKEYAIIEGKGYINIPLLKKTDKLEAGRHAKCSFHLKPRMTYSENDICPVCFHRMINARLKHIIPILST